MSGNNDKHQSVNRPSIFYWGTEIGRALVEIGMSIPFRTFYKNEKKGDGHPILVLPGFMAGDRSTSGLRGFIKDLDYEPITWDLGRNYAKVEYIEKLIEKIENVYHSHDEKISLIGWSLGGVFARQLAKERPQMIRQVITLGSPFQGVNESNNAAWLYDFLVKRDKIKKAAPELFADLPNPAPVPTTCIYTKEDGIVPWQFCIEKEENFFHQNVQVRGSHLGLGVNPSVLKIIANRLLLEEESWEPFVPDSYFDDWVFYPSL